MTGDATNLSIRQLNILNVVKARPGVTHPEIVALSGHRYYYREVGATLIELTDHGALVAQPAPVGSRAALKYYAAGTP